MLTAEILLPRFTRLAEEQEKTPPTLSDIEAKLSEFSMARITVEDCLKTIPNRFELVLAATYRARQLVQGHSPRVESRDKATVVALREVAAGVTDRDMLTKVPL